MSTLCSSQFESSREAVQPSRRVFRWERGGKTEGMDGSGGGGRGEKSREQIMQKESGRLSRHPLCLASERKQKKPKTKQNNKCRVRRAGSQFSFSPRSLEWSTSAPWCRLLEKGWRVSAYRWSGWLPGSVMLPRWRTGSGWASVLKTQLSRGIRSSLENSRYRYLSVSARKKLCCTSSYVGLEE